MQGATAKCSRVNFKPRPNIQTRGLNFNKGGSKKGEKGAGGRKGSHSNGNWGSCTTRTWRTRGKHKCQRFFDTATLPHSFSPKMPNDPAKTLSWIRRFVFIFGSENLTHILTTIPSTGPVDVVSCNDRFFLERKHGVQAVGDNWKVWQYLLEATCNTDIEEKLASFNSVHEAWGVVTEWTLPRLRQRKPSFPNNWRTLKCTPTKTPKRSLYASTSS